MNPADSERGGGPAHTSLRRGGVLACCLTLMFAALAAASWAAANDLDLVSRATGAAGAKSRVGSYSPTISADGRLVAFTSIAGDLDADDTDMTPDVYARDLQTSTTTLVSRAAGNEGVKGNGTSEEPAVSADGRFVAFESVATNLHPDDTDLTKDVFLRDLQAQTLTVVSRGAGGAKGNNFSWGASVSADGRFVAFESFATNLHPDDTDATVDVFVRDLQTSTTMLVSRASGGAKGNNGSGRSSISADGRFVAFTSVATNLHPDDTDATQDVFVRDLHTGTTTLVSRANGAGGAKADHDSTTPSISADGRFVAFNSIASNLAPVGPMTSNVYVRDLQASTTTLASRADGANGAAGNLNAMRPAISGDGRFVAFDASASNLHPDDTDATFDVFVRDLQASTTTLISRAAGASGTKGNNNSFAPAVSGTGRFVAFESSAYGLHPDDSGADFTPDVFRRDVLGGPPDEPPAPPPAPPPPPPSPSPPARDRTAPAIAIAGVRGLGRRCAEQDFRVSVRVRDASRLSYTRLALDGRRRLSTTAKSFHVLIRASRLTGGRHRVTVTARDVAGNRSERSVRFTRCARRK